MPAKNSEISSGLLSKIKKIKKNVGEYVPPGGGGLPAGIDHGKAVVTQVKIGTYEKGDNKGSEYFMVRGVCISPKKIQVDSDWVDTAGVSDSLLMEPLHDTPTRKRTTQDQHVEFMLQVLDQLGVKPSEIDEDSIKDGSLFAALVETKPLVSFRTWKSEPTKEYPDPRVNITFGKGLGHQEDDDEEAEDGVDDDTEEEDVDEPEDSSEDVNLEDEDVDELATLATDKDDEDASAKLIAIAVKAGIKEDVAEGTDTWQDLADMIKEALDGNDEDEDEDEDEPIEPEKGEVYGYKPPKFKKVLECTVTKVLKRSKVVSLKCASNKKTYDKIAWDSLVAIEE